MEELSKQPKPQIFPLQEELSLTVLSHLANGKLAFLNGKASSLINNIATDAEVIFQNEDEAAKMAVGLVTETLRILWSDERTAQSAKQLQIIQALLTLKKQGFDKERIVQRLKLHFFWGH